MTNQRRLDGPVPGYDTVPNGRHELRENLSAAGAVPPQRDPNEFVPSRSIKVAELEATLREHVAQVAEAKAASSMDRLAKQIGEIGYGDMVEWECALKQIAETIEATGKEVSYAAVLHTWAKNYPRGPAGRGP